VAAGAARGPLVLATVVAPRWPGLKAVVASPDAENTRSIRALAKAGFTPATEIVATAGSARPERPELLYVLDRLHMLGPGPGPGSGPAG